MAWNPDEYYKPKVCKRCGKELLHGDFRQLRKQYTGVCKVCETRDDLEREIRMQERRQEELENRRRNMLRLVEV